MSRTLLVAGLLSGMGLMLLLIRALLPEDRVDWELARAEIERCAGSQFEPELARTFLGYLDEEPAADGEPDEQRPEPDE